MTSIGYALSSEEHGPNELVKYAQQAEQSGFEFALISDHYHPWTDQQGNSPFAWTTIGGIAATTSRLGLGTGVTCPIMRYPPAILAQAAATAACMMPGRFFLGVGTGENLNEHIVGENWPPVSIRQEMLEEAVEIIRNLWQGDYYTHDGPYFTVHNARLYTLPQQLPPIYVAAAGPESAELAGRIGDGLCSTAPQAELVQTFHQAGGQGKPVYGQITVCYEQNQDEAVETAYKWWPNAAIQGAVSQELPLPTHFEQAAKTVTKEDIAKAVICGPDPEPHIQAIRQFADAGFTHVYVHQVGPDQDGFFSVYQREILPRFQNA